MIKERYEAYQKSGKSCEQLAQNIEKCVWPGKGEKKLWSRVYKVKLGKAANDSYVECRSFVGDVECHSEVILCPSFQLYYAFFLNENPDWREFYIGDFEYYFRGIFESMRVIK